MTRSLINGEETQTPFVKERTDTWELQYSLRQVEASSAFRQEHLKREIITHVNRMTKKAPLNDGFRRLLQRHFSPGTQFSPPGGVSPRLLFYLVVFLTLLKRLLQAPRRRASIDPNLPCRTARAPATPTRATKPGCSTASEWLRPPRRPPNRPNKSPRRRRRRRPIERAYTPLLSLMHTLFNYSVT